jgi:hypothetical protein
LNSEASLAAFIQWTKCRILASFNLEAFYERRPFSVDIRVRNMFKRVPCAGAPNEAVGNISAFAKKDAILHEPGQEPAEMGDRSLD